MTADEARNNIIACEHEVKNSYDKLLGSARDIASSGYNAAYEERNTILKEAKNQKTLYDLLALAVPVFGIFLCVCGAAIWGVILIIGGAILTYNVVMNCSISYDKTKKAADDMLNRVSIADTKLKTTIDSLKHL